MNIYIVKKNNLNENIKNNDLNMIFLMIILNFQHFNFHFCVLKCCPALLYYFLPRHLSTTPRFLPVNDVITFALELKRSFSSLLNSAHYLLATIAMIHFKLNYLLPVIIISLKEIPQITYIRTMFKVFF